jgi:adenylate kinase family enzyme
LKKVIFIGSHGTGKSTLAKHMEEEIRKANPGMDVRIIDHLSEEAKKKGYKLNIFESQTYAIKAQLVLLRSYLRALGTNKDADVLLIPDNMVRQYVYSEYNGMYEEFLDLLRDFMNKEIRNSLILYIPIEFALPWDRHPSESFHKAIDNSMIDILDKAREDGNLCYTIKGAEMERVKIAMEAYNEFCKSSSSSSKSRSIRR